MLLTDITKIIRVLLVAFDAVASKDELTQRRIGQIGEVIGAVEDVAEREAANGAAGTAGDAGDVGEAVAARRVDEAHDIIHRIAAILAMEAGEGKDVDGSGGFGGGQLQRIPWDGKLDDSMIMMLEDGDGDEDECLIDQ